VSTHPELARSSSQLRSPTEGCESGRIGRSRKPLWALPTVGSNPTPSARSLSRFLLNDPFFLRRVRFIDDLRLTGTRPRQGAPEVLVSQDL
jgi:hypothetical protein